MVQPKKPASVHTVVKTAGSSTNKFVLMAVKILFVLVILFLLPKFVEAKRRKPAPKRTVIHARTMKSTCETTVCGAYPLEEGLNCVSACLSPACFQQVYGVEPLEDGELDFARAQQFDECFLSELKQALQRQRQQKK